MNSTSSPESLSNSSVAFGIPITCYLQAHDEIKVIKKKEKVYTVRVT